MGLSSETQPTALTPLSPALHLGELNLGNFVLKPSENLLLPSENLLFRLGHSLQVSLSRHASSESLLRSAEPKGVLNRRVFLLPLHSEISFATLHQGPVAGDAILRWP